MAQITRQTVVAAREDVAVFAEVLIGEPLWDHQLDLARSTARVSACCSGRQAGKSRALAVVALHDAFRRPDRVALVISAGDAAALNLLAEISRLAQSPLLAGSVVDNERHRITLSNGSVIRSVPASEKQIRGLSVDVLILDEASFVAEEVWQAARFTTIARPGSRVILASTPWGPQDKFFAQAYRAGQRGEEGYASFHWPSLASPVVDAALLDIWRASSSDREFRREVLAEWVDSAGSYFSEAELDAATADYELVPPDRAGHRRGVAGVDWGLRVDSSAIVVLAEAGPGDLPDEWPPHTFYVPWIDEGQGVAYATFVRRAADVAKGYRLRRVASETNGVGQMPTDELHRLLRFHSSRVVPVTTTSGSKEDGFGRLKVLLSQGRLALPRHPRLLAQLAALEFEERDTGTVHIAVPERQGHDDLAMALMLAVSESDVSSIPSVGRISVAEGKLPTAPIDRHDGPPPAPAPSVVSQGQQREVEKLYSFNRARRDPRYQPPQRRW